MSWEFELESDTPRGLPGQENTVPNAQWGSPGSLGEAWAYKRTSVLLGYRGGKAIGSGDDRHLMLVAGSRAGKGVSLIVPNLLLYEGSVLALDPKGELAQITAKRRARGLNQGVHVLDPFDASGPETREFRARFNPLAEIDSNSPTAIDDAALLADALIVDDGSEKHWTNAARELIKALILDTLLRPKEERHLGTVRDFFLLHPDQENDEPTSGQNARLLDIAENKKSAFDGLLAGLAAGLVAKNEREFASIVSTAEVQTGFLDSKPLRESVTASDFKLADLKRQKTTVYLCLPASRMSTHAKWFRVVVTLAMLMCERVPQKPEPPLLMLLDEFPVLGYMRPIEAAAGQIAGFGVRIWTVLQDLTQLKRHYKESWETFMGNSGTTIFFGNSDNTTLEYVSRKLGKIGFDITRDTKASPSARLGGARAFDEQLQMVSLLEPHEVEMMFAREYHRALVLSPGMPPLVVRRADYRTDEPLKGLRDAV